MFFHGFHSPVSFFNDILQPMTMQLYFKSFKVFQPNKDYFLKNILRLNWISAWWSLVIFNTRYIIWGILNGFNFHHQNFWHWNKKFNTILFEIVQLFKLGRVLTAVRKLQPRIFSVDFNFICLILAFGWQNDQDEYERRNSGRVRAFTNL